MSDNTTELPSYHELKAMGFKSYDEWKAARKREEELLAHWQHSSTAAPIPATSNSYDFSPPPAQPQPVHELQSPAIPPKPPSTYRKSSREWRGAAKAGEGEMSLEQYQLWKQEQEQRRTNPAGREPDTFYAGLRDEQVINRAVYGFRQRLRWEDNIREEGKYVYDDGMPSEPLSYQDWVHVGSPELPTDALRLRMQREAEKAAAQQARAERNLTFIRDLVKAGAFSDFPGATQRAGLEQWEGAVHPTVLFEEEGTAD